MLALPLVVAVSSPRLAGRSVPFLFVTVRQADDVTFLNHTTRFDGYLGMSNDEERSEMRYVVRIAEFSESSRL